MKIQIPCRQCQAEGLPVSFTYTDLELETTSTYNFTCRNDHHTVCLLMTHPFQLLFDLGMMAISDGYTREAVSSLSAAVERFYEYAIDVFLEKCHINEGEVEATWKLVSNQSERQLGGYYFLYLQAFGRAPEKMKTEWVTFRNKVIHKGHIPKYAEVMEYAEYAFQYMVNTLMELKETHAEYMLTWLERRKTEYAQANPDAHLDVMAYPTFIDLRMTKGELAQVNFKATIQTIETYVDELFNR